MFLYALGIFFLDDFSRCCYISLYNLVCLRLLHIAIEEWHIARAMAQSHLGARPNVRLMVSSIVLRVKYGCGYVTASIDADLAHRSRNAQLIMSNNIPNDIWKTLNPSRIIFETPTSQKKIHTRVIKRR
jgi:hypothetical protein